MKGTAWTGFVDDAGIFTLDRRRDFVAWVKQFAGREVTLTLTERKRKRSLEQNAWLWGVALPAIAEHCGYDHHEHERLHYDLLAVRFGTVAVAPLIPGAPPRIVPAQTSSPMNTREFSDYMEWLVRYAAETFGIVIPLPDERHQEAA
jgi:hypothetical protein